MKTRYLPAIVLSLFSQFALAQAQSVFKGFELKSGQRCEISIEAQNPELSMYTVIYETPEMSLHFYNETLQENAALKVTGLFQKEGGSMQAVIGSPIFPFGRYYNVSLKQTSNGYEIKTRVQVGAIVGAIPGFSQTDICQ